MRMLLLGLMLVLASCGDNSEVFVMNEYWFNHYKKTCTRYCKVFGDDFYKFDSIRITKEDDKKTKETCECSATKGAATWYKYIDIVH